MSDAFLSPEEIVELGGVREWRATAEHAVQITRLSAISSATEESLVFAEGNESYLLALASTAGLILVPLKLAAEHPVGSDPRVLPVADPRLTFALCARALERKTAAAEGPTIHSGASVDATARLGRRVVIHAGASIGPHATLGDDVRVGPNAVVADGVQVGHRVVVQAGAVLGSKGFGYVRDPNSGEYLLFPQQGALVIEDDVEIGANTTIDRGALEETRIGAGTKIDNLVHIGHNCRVGKRVIIAAQVGISGSCVIEDGAILAGQVGISDHCHIGPGVILGGQAGVYRGKEIQGPGEVFSGTPAEPLREQMRSLARLRRLR